MPRRAKKCSALQERNHQHLSLKYSDFTVYDHYARRSKPSTAWRTEVKQIAGQSAVQQCELVSPVPDDWSESTFDDDDQSQPSSSKPPISLSSSVNKNISVQSVGTQNVYPIDLWFLISEHVFPEDISLFARICRGSHVVVHSARFWIGVYRRFCQSPLSQSAFLQPKYVEQRVHGLRTRVVRALFHVYPPLSTRGGHRGNGVLTVAAGSMPTSSLVNPETLVGLRCVLAWHEHCNKQQQWRFFFRFERGGSASASSKRAVCPLSASRDGESDDLLAPDDVMHNPDERSVILVAATTHFIKLPVVMGLVLVKAAMSTDGLFARRLRLVFCNEYVHAGRGGALPSGAVAVEIEPVSSGSVLHWWDPGFPVRR